MNQRARLTMRSTRTFSGLLLQALDGLTIWAVMWLCVNYFYVWAPYYSIATVISILTFLLMGIQAGLYEMEGHVSPAPTTLALIQAWATMVLAIILLAYVTKTSALYSRAAMLSWMVIAPCTMIVVRVVGRMAIAQYRSRRKLQESAAIVGLTDSALQLFSLIRERNDLGITIEGFYAADTSLVKADLDGVEILGNIEELIVEAQNGRYDTIYLAALPSDSDQIRALVHDLAETRVRLKYIPDIFTLNLLNSRISDVCGLPCVDVYFSPLDGVGSLVKRAEDLIIGTALITLFAIPMLLIAVFVGLESKGPILFRQTRYGLNGEKIEVWKFRTMTVQESGAEAVQASRNDDRITAVGRVLRKTSLDELPQFFNVLAGSMSIVGPRPHPVSLNEKFRFDIEGYMLRHTVKPGITGWAQINGWRGETETPEKMEHRVQHDLYYIRNWSLWFDLRIIFITAVRIPFDRNAY